MYKGESMEYIISAATDIGISKETNQDSYGVKLIDTKLGRIVAAVLCDGMGGLSKGELASATVVDAFQKWMMERLPVLCEFGITDDVIRDEWTDIVLQCNEKIHAYGYSAGIDLGTTVAVLMLTGTRYFIMNIGDSRVYEIADRARSITRDQTVVAREVESGIITEEQAMVDPRRSVLLQCVGASDEIVPDLFFGETKKGAVYMLCSDGFRHEITPEEIHQYLNASVNTDAGQLQQNMKTLIELNKQRQERDNITVVTVRTY